MAFIGERAFINRELDDLWVLMHELIEETETGNPTRERLMEIDVDYHELRNRYDYYFQRLQECEIPWWKS